jgi:tellurium resistance protein TerD
VEIARYDISEKMKSETAVIFGEIYRKRGDWWFTAVGEGYDGGLRPIAKKYGVSV